MRVENSYIPVRGVGEHTERSLWEAGATRWEDFDRDLVGETVGERIERFIEAAEPRLDAGDPEFFAERFPSEEQWRLYENFKDETLFLDIETTGLDQRRDSVTTVSIHQDGETRTFVQGRDLTAGRLRAAFDEAALLATFNGAQFDVPFLETQFDLDVAVPHLDLRFLARRIGLTGGLKAIEGTIGIERDRPDISGREAVRLWRAYERGDSAALDTLISYNREDTVNLERLMDHVCSRLHDRVTPDSDLSW